MPALLALAIVGCSAPTAAPTTAPAAPAQAPAVTGSPTTGAAPAGGQAASSGAREKLVVGYVALNATQLPSWVAKETGIFDRNGLDVELQYIQSGSSPTAALLSGQIQVLVAAEQAIQATLNGGELTYVAAPTSTIFFSLYAQPSIADAASLKGKKIGITAVGSATHTAGKMAVRSLGLDPARDVTFVNIGSAPNILAAMQNGAIDAGVLSSPTNIQANKFGMKLLVDVAKLQDPFPSGWAAVSKKFAGDHQDAVQKYVRSIAEAVAFETKNPDQTKQILAKYTKIDDAATVQQAYEEVVPYLNKNPVPDVKAVQTALDELSATEPKAKGADPKTFVETRFADQLQSSGLIDGLYK